MSDNHDEVRICPYCGQENAPYTLRCIRCGRELEELFELEGFETSSVPDSDQPENDLAPMADLLASLDDSPLLMETNKDEDDALEKASETEVSRSGSETDEPDWLEKIRQRAKEEEDAAGELAKGGIAMDDRRSQEGRKQVDEAFDEIMRRIREQNEREKARRSRHAESDLVDENGDPEWLRRIRELHPAHEDSGTEAINPFAKNDNLEDEWTEEELQELLRREMGLPETPDEEPEEEITTEIITPLPVTLELQDQADEPIPDEVNQTEAEIYHNIPDDEETPDLVEEDHSTAEPESEETEAYQADEGLETEEHAESKEVPLEEVTESDLEKKADGIEDGIPEETDVEEVLEEESEPAPSTEEPLSTENVLPDLLLLRHQRERAQVFNEIIGQEGRRTIAVLHETSYQGKIGRLVLGLLLIFGVLLTILLGPQGSLNLPLSAPAAAFTKNLDSIGSDKNTLIVLDYQAATRNDIEPLAARTLNILEDKGVNLRVVTSNPENVWLASDLLDPNQALDEFVPGGMLGYLALAVADSPSWGELPVNQAFTGDPELFSGVGQVILVSDSAEFVRMWLEQVSPWRPNNKTSAITTAVSAPILLPYYDSGQLAGFVAGVADAKALDVEPDKLVNQRAFQVGMLLMIVVLLLGMITKADEDAQRRSEVYRR